MKNNISIVQEIIPFKKKLKAGDVFYYKTTEDIYFYGMVALEKIDVGPFKNCILIYLYNQCTSILDKNVSLKKEELLLPPIITDNSCWKNGYFQTFKLLNAVEDVFCDHFFKNPLNNKIYNSKGIVTKEASNTCPIGEWALNFDRNVIRLIGETINSLKV